MITRVNAEFEFLEHGAKLADIERCLIPHRIERWIEKGWNHKEKVYVYCNKRWMTVPKSGFCVVNYKVMTPKEFKTRYILKYDEIIIFDPKNRDDRIDTMTKLMNDKYMIIFRTKALIVKKGDWICFPTEMRTLEVYCIPKHLAAGVLLIR